MVADFSPKAMEILFSVPKGKSLAANRIVTLRQCHQRFAELVGLLSANSIPTALKADYDSWMGELAKYRAAS